MSVRRGEMGKRRMESHDCRKTRICLESESHDYRKTRKCIELDIMTIVKLVNGNFKNRAVFTYASIRE